MIPENPPCSTYDERHGPDDDLLALKRGFWDSYGLSFTGYLSGLSLTGNFMVLIYGNETGRVATCFLWDFLRGIYNDQF